MKLGKIAKGGTYLVTGTANLLHASYHLYAGAIAASHAHGHETETSQLAEKLESAMHHPAGQIAALSFLPIMAWDIYKHRKHHKEIKQYEEIIEQKNKEIDIYRERLKQFSGKDDIYNQM